MNMIEAAELMARTPELLKLWQQFAGGPPSSILIPRRPCFERRVTFPMPSARASLAESHVEYIPAKVNYRFAR